MDKTTSLCFWVRIISPYLSDLNPLSPAGQMVPSSPFKSCDTCVSAGVQGLNKGRLDVRSRGKFFLGDRKNYRLLFCLTINYEVVIKHLDRGGSR